MTQFDVRQVLSRRALPPGFDPGKGIAALCGPRPASIKALGKLPPKTVTFDSGEFAAGSVIGNCQLAINSDGFWSFKGHVHEGGIVGDEYVMALGLVDLKDAAGANFVAHHTGTIHGTLVPGSSDDNWEGGPGDSGFDQRIVDHWDAAVNSGSRSTLHVATTVGDVIGIIVEGLALGGAVAFFGSGNAKCDRVTMDENGNAQLICAQKSQ